MQITINNSSDRAVYQQIIDQIKRDIALGRLRQDDKLLTVRKLASQLVINPNTIAKAYRQLEREGIIVTRPGAGAFVAPLENKLSKSVCTEIICEQLERTIVDAVHMQIDKKTLTDYFTTALGKFNL